MKLRSPVLGYNHNVRYAGRLWHVQTEDSGVHSPHVFTHLFHDGTILATKRLDYDPESDIATVQRLMQVQHKQMLRELKTGSFDERIEKFLGAPVVRSEASEPIVESAAVVPVVPVTPAPPPMTPPPRRPTPVPASSRRAQPTAHAPVYTPTPKRPAAEGVVVARPAVIVGAEPPGGRRVDAGGPDPNAPTSDSIFGGDLVAEKSLDEVILAYLSEDLNDK